MAEQEQVTTLAGSLVNVLTTVKVLCDSSTTPGVAALTRDQEAALHTFVYKVLASLSRLYEKVPQETVHQIISEKLQTAMKDFQDSQKG